MERLWTQFTRGCETGAGPFAARRVSDREVELEMAPAADDPAPVVLDGEGLDPPLEGWSLLVGVPHAVLPWEQPLGALPIARLGPPVRRHRLFPQGANANFVRFGGLHDFDIRTWERGVEAETLACGSGVLASVATGIFDGRLVLPVRARTRGGFVLTVGGEVEHNRVVRWTSSNASVATIRTIETANTRSAVRRIFFGDMNDTPISTTKDGSRNAMTKASI